jgi:hypothetical protein
MRSEIRRHLEAVAFDPELTADKLVLIAGPRQAGKTTLARGWLARHGCGSLYFNWDDPTVRGRYRRDPHFFEPAARRLDVPSPWIAFDEVHKSSRWRDMLKGWYDVFQRDFRFLVTGSARLDLFRRGGDSLVGRYLLFHLFPLSFHELVDPAAPPGLPAPLGPGPVAPDWDAAPGSWPRFRQFLARGPFPDPLLRDSDRFSRRWAQDYVSLVLRQDVRDLTRLADLDRLETLLTLLPAAIGSPLSYSSLGRDLEVAHTTVRVWLEALRRFYLVFPVRPHARRIRRALRRDAKWYFLDWSHVGEPAPRLENLVASCLYQACQCWSDAGHGRFELRYLRLRDGREVDFVLLDEGRPRLAVEVKLTELEPSPALRRRAEQLGPGVLGVQVVGAPDVARRVDDGLWVVSADRFLRHV